MKRRPPSVICFGCPFKMKLNLWAILIDRSSSSRQSPQQLQWLKNRLFRTQERILQMLSPSNPLHPFFSSSALSETPALSVQVTALHKYQTPHSDTCTLAWYGCCQTPIASGLEVLYTSAPEHFWKGSKRIDQPYLMIPDKLGRDIDPFYDPLRQLCCKLHRSPVRNASTTGKKIKSKLEKQNGGFFNWPILRVKVAV